MCVEKYLVMFLLKICNKIYKLYYKETSIINLLEYINVLLKR